MYEEWSQSVQQKYSGIIYRSSSRYDATVFSYCKPPCKQGLTALHMVCREWHYECLKYLLDHCNVDINVAAERNGETPLHMAVKKATPSRPTTQCLQVLKILLERGADCNK